MTYSLLNEPVRFSIGVTVIGTVFVSLGAWMWRVDEETNTGLLRQPTREAMSAFYVRRFSPPVVKPVALYGKTNHWVFTNVPFDGGDPYETSKVRMESNTATEETSVTVNTRTIRETNVVERLAERCENCNTDSLGRVLFCQAHNGRWLETATINEITLLNFNGAEHRIDTNVVSTTKRLWRWKPVKEYIKVL